MMDNRFNKFCSAYKLLGVEVGSSLNEIKSSYRRLAKKFHPDKNRGKCEESAHERFTLLRDSYVLLCDDVERRRFEESYLSARNTSSQFRQNYEFRTKDRSSFSGNDSKANKPLKKGSTSKANLESLHRESIHLINLFRDHLKTRISEGEHVDISEQSLRDRLKNVRIDKIVDKFNEFENIVLLKLVKLTQENGSSVENTSPL